MYWFTYMWKSPRLAPEQKKSPSKGAFRGEPQLAEPSDRTPSSSRSSAASNRYSHSSSGYAEFLFKSFYHFVQFQNGKGFYFFN